MDRKLRRIGVTVTIGWDPYMARTLARLKHENILSRALKGEVPMSQEEIDKLAVSRVDIASVAVLAHGNDEDYYLIARGRRTKRTRSRLLRDIPAVGFCRMTWRPEYCMYQFRQFYVNVALKGRGIGSQIMRTAIEQARESRLTARGVFLMVGDYNTHAQSMYEHWGFRRVPVEEPILDGPGGTDTGSQWLRMELHF